MLQEAIHILTYNLRHRYVASCKKNFLRLIAPSACTQYGCSVIVFGGQFRLSRFYEFGSSTLFRIRIQLAEKIAMECSNVWVQLEMSVIRFTISTVSNNLLEVSFSFTPMHRSHGTLQMHLIVENEIVKTAAFYSSIVIE